MTKTALMMVAGAAIALAGCSTKPDLPGSSLGATFTAERYLTAEHGGPGFNGALAREYTELGRRAAFEDVRWYNSTAYIQKARAAESGSQVDPWSPESLGVSGEAGGMYDQVVNTIMANKDERPEACARAQAMWDQYLEALRGEPAGCLPPEDARALLEEALAQCAPAAVADTNYIVYFGFDRTDITDRAREVLDQVAEAVSSLGSAALSVVGHADTVGSDSYNQALSEARARSVASVLADRGIPTGAMTLAGRGERELARPTGDNVREPLNRRVEITLSD